MAISKKPEGEIVAQLVQYLKDTPSAAAVLFFAFLEGHLWLFMITVFRKGNTKGNAVIKSATGRTGIGLVWMSLSMLIVYWAEYKAWPTDYRHILSLVVPTIFLSLLLQLLAFVACVIWGERK